MKPDPCPYRRTGAAIGSFRSRSSSGRIAKIVSTTASATLANPAAAGESCDWLPEGQMTWIPTVLRAVVIVGILYWLLDLAPWPAPIRRAQLSLWRRLGNRGRMRDALRRLAADAVVRGDPAAAVELRREIIE